MSQRIADMQAMQRSLQTLVQCCHGDDLPDCPILDTLAAANGQPLKPAKALKSVKTNQK